MAAQKPCNSYWWHHRQAARSLRAGAVWAYPTEAVWGLGCDPWDEAAVARVLALKNRPRRKGLILVAADTDQVRDLLAALPDALRQEVRSHWPGPTTVLLPDPAGLVPEWVRGQHDSVAVRVSAYEPVVSLCRAFGGPLVSTSCNPASRPPARYSWQARRYFGADVDGYLPGRVAGQRRPSRILDPLSGQVLRG